VSEWPWEDTLGGDVDPQQVIDNLIRQRMPDLASTPGIDPQGIVNRMIRKAGGAQPSQSIPLPKPRPLQAPQPAPQPGQPAPQPQAAPQTFDASAYGTPADDDQAPAPQPEQAPFDASQYGTPEEEPKPKTAGGSLTDYPIELAKSAAEAPKSMLAASLQGTAAATAPKPVPPAAGRPVG
jgi:hypothetical protein